MFVFNGLLKDGVFTGHTLHNSGDNVDIYCLQYTGVRGYGGFMKAA